MEKIAKIIIPLIIIGVSIFFITPHLFAWFSYTSKWKFTRTLEEYFEIAKNIPAYKEAYKKIQDQEKTTTKEVACESLNQENEKLKAALNYAKQNKFELELAEIIGYSSDPFSQLIIVKIGNTEKIKSKMTVIDEGGWLIGTIDHITAHIAYIKRIQSPDVILLGRAKEIEFIIKGVGNHVLGTKIPRMTNFENVPVITSGLDGKVPTGLMVGIIKKSSATKNQVFEEAIIESKSALNYANVFIITNFNPTSD